MSASAPDAWFRFIPFTPAGELAAPLYPLQRIRGLSVASLTPLDAANETWATFSHDTILDLSMDPAWNATYGSFGTLRPGSGIALLSSFGQGVSFDKSANLTLRNVSNFAVKAGLTFWGGEGGHLVTDFYSGPRPGTNQLLGGDGCNNAHGRVGATIDRSTFVTSTDDLLNFHTYFSEVVGVVGRTLLFVPDSPSDGADGPNSYTVGAARATLSNFTTPLRRCWQHRLSSSSSIRALSHCLPRRPHVPLERSCYSLPTAGPTGAFPTRPLPTCSSASS